MPTPLPMMFQRSCWACSITSSGSTPGPAEKLKTRPERSFLMMEEGVTGEGVAEGLLATALMGVSSGAGRGILGGSEWVLARAGRDGALDVAGLGSPGTRTVVHGSIAAMLGVRGSMGAERRGGPAARGSCDQRVGVGRLPVHGTGDEPGLFCVRTGADVQHGGDWLRHAGGRTRTQPALLGQCAVRP